MDHVHGRSHLNLRLKQVSRTVQEKFRDSTIFHVLYAYCRAIFRIVILAFPALQSLQLASLATPLIFSTWTDFISFLPGTLIIQADL
jgi:hypothetical protein